VKVPGGRVARQEVHDAYTNGVRLDEGFFTVHRRWLIGWRIRAFCALRSCRASSLVKHKNNASKSPPNARASAADVGRHAPMWAECDTLIVASLAERDR
jgi:hypothetical protein